MTHRLFVAVDVGEAVAGSVARAIARVRATAALARWTRDDAGHVTLAFLGAVSPDTVPALRLALRRVAAGHQPFSLEVRGAGVFGHPAHPRVLWAAIAGDLPAVTALHADVADALRSLAFDLETRAFHPHLTLARARGLRGEAGLAACAHALADLVAGPVEVRDVVLYESELGPTGARHCVVERFALGEPHPPSSLA